MAYIRLNIILLILLASSFVGAQSFSGYDTGVESKGILYNKEKAFKARLQSNGFNIGWYSGKIRTYYKTNFTHYEIGYHKNNHELSQRFDYSNPFTSQSARSFVFGKQNSLYVARVGFGQKYYYSDKQRHRGISIGSTYEFGGILGLKKPYYLELIRYKDNGSSAYLSKEKYSEENKEVFTDLSRIFGGPSFFEHWDEVRPVPGVYGRAGMLFEWDTLEGYFTGVEAGIQADAFPTTVNLMIDQPKQIIFINLYLSVEIGKRK